MHALNTAGKSFLSKVGIIGRDYPYKMGEIGDPGTDAGHRGGSVSWIRRAFWFNKYAYFIAKHNWLKDEPIVFYIARAPKNIEFRSYEESVSLPDGMSGLEHPSSEYRLQHQQPEEALTKFGYWLNTPWTD